LDHHLRLARVAQLVSGWVLLLMARMHSVRAKIRQPKKMKKSMIGKTLATLAAATARPPGAACTPAVTACTVRHHYAIVIFENGGAALANLW